MKGVFWVFLLLNAVALFAALNPWTDQWHRSGAIVLLVEVALIVLFVAPAVAYQALFRKKPWRMGLADSLRWLLDILGGWT